MKEYTEIIHVQEEDLDDLKHVNNVRYVQWIQDIAKNHWLNEASKEMLDAYIWMVLTHYIEYKGQAFLNDEILLKTYIEKAKGVTSTRIVEIYNNKTEKLLLRSKTDWCLIDKNSKRPIRLTDQLKNMFT
ncbi:acyl-CoA thioesterase [Galbibacter pacificus]|uniref:Thioesterase n=1 Tax=Galbibacter pacificus TaxID=2996052 RepID=A0ABT6FQG7_9FLAO|nr:thioesterase family protein [Galbibacter pacificus]MDG3582013.1 thioesterase [Galbibacter pacificus]MDG3585513.1 thioesterase [Galbibacter pacificus]